MQVIRDINQIPVIQNAVVTNGTFDGTHIGHHTILNQLIDAAKKSNGKSVVITYWPHPRIVLGHSGDDFKLLYTIDERIELLKEYDIDYLIIIPFSKEFANQTSEEFIHNILIDKINTKKLIIGYNHRFGKNREGSFEFLSNNAFNYGFEIEEISKQVIDEEGVSSTKIREALRSGDVKTANSYLNKTFYIKGKVVKGNQIGRTIDFPTANIEIDSNHKIIPGEGVYFVNVTYDSKNYFGMMNIGSKPTIDSYNNTLEVHLFEFDKTIYSEELKIEFLDKIRTIHKFDSLEMLKIQLKLDRNHCLELIKDKFHYLNK